MRESRTIIAAIMIGILMVGLCACTSLTDRGDVDEQTTEVESTEWCLVDTPNGYKKEQDSDHICFSDDQKGQIWIGKNGKEYYNDALSYIKQDTSRSLDGVEKIGNYTWIISKYWAKNQEGETVPNVDAYTDVSDNNIVSIHFSNLNKDSEEINTVLSSFKYTDEADLEGVDITRSEANAKDFTPSISLDERKAINVDSFFRDPLPEEEYFFNKVFDFSAYMESLGYMRLVSPEDESDVMYAITRDNISLFIFEGDDAMPSSIYADCKDGFLYAMETERPYREKPYYDVVSKDESEKDVGAEQLNQKIEIVKYIATSDKVILSEIPNIKYMYKFDNIPKYYTNGLIEYNPYRFGECVETIKSDTK